MYNKQSMCNCWCEHWHHTCVMFIYSRMYLHIVCYREKSNHNIIHQLNGNWCNLFWLTTSIIPKLRCACKYQPSLTNWSLLFLCTLVSCACVSARARARTQTQNSVSQFVHFSLFFFFFLLPLRPINYANYSNIQFLSLIGFWIIFVSRRTQAHRRN